MIRVIFDGVTSSREVSLEPAAPPPCEVVAETPRRRSRHSMEGFPPAADIQQDGQLQGAGASPSAPGDAAQEGPSVSAVEELLREAARVLAPNKKAEAGLDAVVQLPGLSAASQQQADRPISKSDKLPGAGEGVQQRTRDERSVRLPTGLELPSSDRVQVDRPAGETALQEDQFEDAVTATTAEEPAKVDAQASPADMTPEDHDAPTGQSLAKQPAEELPSTAPVLPDVAMTHGARSVDSGRLLHVSAAVAAADTGALDAALCKVIEEAMPIPVEVMAPEISGLASDSQALEASAMPIKKGRAGKTAPRGAPAVPFAVRPPSP